MGATSLLLIYPDFLGDFLLFFPFLSTYAERFETDFSQVNWLCHPSIEPLANAYKPQWPGNLRLISCNFDYTGLSPKGLLKWPWRQQQVKQFLTSQSLPLEYSQVWCPSFMPWLANSVLMAVKSPRKLSRTVQNKTYNRLQGWLNTDLFIPPDFDQFVVYQHHGFFEKAFQHTLPLPKPIHIVETTPKSLDTPYVVLVPDSAATSKEWPPERFAQLVNQLLNNTPLEVIILGVRDTTRQALNRLLRANSRIHNLMGQTSPLDLLNWVKHAEAVVCNDSFALHAAIANNIPVICVTNGSYKGRYWPYPDAYMDTTHHYYVVTPDNRTNLAAIPMEAVWYRLEPILNALISQH